MGARGHHVPDFSGKDTDRRREDTDLRSQVHIFKQVLFLFLTLLTPPCFYWKSFSMWLGIPRN